MKNILHRLYRLMLIRKNEGFITSSQVQYVAKGANFMRLGYKYTGVMKVLETNHAL